LGHVCRQHAGEIARLFQHQADRRDVLAHGISRRGDEDRDRESPGRTVAAAS
jgi:hypothetical protein